MTLVLPFGCDQIANNSLFSSASGNNQSSSMPCVFDSEAFDRDLESALMRDWTSDITDYDMPAADSPLKAPPVSNDLKRKSTTDDFEQQILTKKLRVDSDDAVPPVQSEIVSSSSNVNSSSTSSTSASSSPFSCSSFESNSASTSCSSSSSSSSSSSEGGQDDEVSVEDEEYMPRRRGPQMWNSRQRWKDERKKVLKMSINKLADIDDPELCLLRSVLLNNTIKKLHMDIRNERQAKLRQRQQRIDFFTERFAPFSSTPVEENSVSDCLTIDFSNANSSNNVFNGESKPSNAQRTNSPPDFVDDSSCDEMFGINEDFLRVPIPDRRVSSPIPSAGPSPKNISKDTEEPMDSSPSTSHSTNCCKNEPCDNDSSFRTISQNNSQTINAAASPQVLPQATTTPHSNNNPRRSSGSAVSSLSNSGSQCAMQYRTNRDLGMGENSFPPRVPILDSVVYHSLLASLESS